jgi:hypothetical protein
MNVTNIEKMVARSVWDMVIHMDTEQATRFYAWSVLVNAGLMRELYPEDADELIGYAADVISRKPENERES